MKILIGSTGVIGKTLVDYSDFTEFHSSNMKHFVSPVVQDGDDLYLSCLPAAKWMVNKNLRLDIENMYDIIQTISRFSYRKVCLISTIDIYNDSPFGVDECYAPNISKLSYGNNRYLFELLVKEFVKTEDLKIFRLPAIFGHNIKKNIIYDLLNNNNVDKININSSFQWYNLSHLWNDINYYTKHYTDQNVINLFNEPIETSEIIKFFPEHKNKVGHFERVEYDYHTKFGMCSAPYLDKNHYVIAQIEEFIDAYRSKQSRMGQ